MSNTINAAVATPLGVAASSAKEQEFNGEIKDYFALLNPRVMSLVVFTGLVGLLLAPGAIHPIAAIAAVFCIALGSGASGAINMWYERDIDSKMKRTKNRPIPAGRVCPDSALEFSIICAFASVFIMAFVVNYVAAVVLLSAILFYVFVYTIWLKPRTPQNIVIGGAAGAFPPMIGWAAVTGGISLESIILFSVIFVWTPPHFWALALYKSDDYAKAGIPMLPVVKGGKNTRLQILLYTLLLLPITLAPYFIGMLNEVYLVGAVALGAIFLSFAFKVYREDVNEFKNARKLFFFSILYLFALFTLMLVAT